MPWQQLHFTVSADEVELMSELLFAANALSVSCSDNQDDAIFEPQDGARLWEQTKIVGLFDVTSDMDTILHHIALGCAPQPLPPYHVDILEDAVWERAWLEYFKPLCIKDTLWICPSEGEKPNDDKPILWLDPGLAFGTGTHATTALCLEALTELPLTGLTIMDYGCGSGILALAALKLGAKKVYAIDNHPQALLATHDNAVKNNIPEKCLTVLPPEECPQIPYDVWIANILLNPLIELAPLFAERIPAGKTLLLSGILDRQADELLQHYDKNFILQKRLERDGWVLLLLVRR
ncbi:MAG: prmA [Gammaproteobacteria bacterium]|nr:prmA [Gammaproteobacteria bacterium]